jgi:hypothetical protein
MLKFSRINPGNYILGVGLLMATIGLLGVGQSVWAFITVVAVIVIAWNELRKII